MEFTAEILIAGALGGVVFVWFLQTIFDVFIISRLLADPVKSKILSTVLAYILACVLFYLFSDSAMGIALYLPGALLIGYWQYRKGLEAQQRGAGASHDFD